MPAKKPIEVRPKGEEWVVARQGSARALSKHPTQKEAEPVGRDQARKDQVEFILKGRDGQIRKKDSSAGTLGDRRGSSAGARDAGTRRRPPGCGDNGTVDRRIPVWARSKPPPWTAPTAAGQLLTRVGPDGRGARPLARPQQWHQVVLFSQEDEVLRWAEQRLDQSKERLIRLDART